MPITTPSHHNVIILLIDQVQAYIYHKYQKAFSSLFFKFQLIFFLNKDMHMIDDEFGAWPYRRRKYSELKALKGFACDMYN